MCIRDRRKDAYAADITYGTNNEFGFDYLRDNMVIYQDQMVQRELNYAIVDEVDSILVDEARTPLIISGAGDKSTEMYAVMAKTVNDLEEGVDYTIDEKAKAVLPTDVYKRQALWLNNMQRSRILALILILLRNKNTVCIGRRYFFAFNL